MFNFVLRSVTWNDFEWKGDSHSEVIPYQYYGSFNQPTNQPTNKPTNQLTFWLNLPCVILPGGI